MNIAIESLLGIPDFLKRKTPKRQRLKEEDSSTIMKQIGPNKFIMLGTKGVEHPGKKIKMPEFIWRRQRKKYKTSLQVQNLKKLGWSNNQIPAITEEQATLIIAKNEGPLPRKKRRACIKKKARAVLLQRSILNE